MSVPGTRQVFIGGLTELGLKKGGVLVKLVPGLGPANDNGFLTEQTPFDLERTREVLNRFCLSFKEETVLLTLNQIGTADVAFLDAVLVSYKIKVKAKYFSFSGAPVIEVSDLILAETTLSLPFEELDRVVRMTLNCDKAGDCKKRHKKCDSSSSS